MVSLRKEIESKRKELEAIEQDLKDLEAAQAVLDGKPRKSTSASRTIAEGTETILKRVGKPMHAREITSELHSRYGKDHSKQTVISALTRYVSKGVKFSRPKPAIFGLLDW